MHLIKQKIAGGSILAGSPALSAPPVSKAPQNIVSDLLELTAPAPASAPKAVPTTSNRMSMLPSVRPAMMESFDNSDIEKQIASKRTELGNLDSQMKILAPASEEMSSKRSALENELRSITEQKHQLTLQYTQLRATYDAETQIVRELEQTLVRERQSHEYTKQQVSQAENAISHLNAENASLSEEIEKFQNDLADMKAQLNGYTESASALKKQLEVVRKEHGDLQTQFRANQATLQASQNEYQQIRRELVATEQTLEQERARAEELTRQLATQTALTNNETEKLKRATAQVQSTVATNESMLAKSKSLDMLHQQLQSQNQVIQNNNALPRRGSITSIASKASLGSQNMLSAQPLTRDLFEGLEGPSMATPASPAKSIMSQFSDARSIFDSPNNVDTKPIAATPPLGSINNFQSMYPPIDQITAGPPIPPQNSKPTNMSTASLDQFGNASPTKSTEHSANVPGKSPKPITMSQFDIDAEFQNAFAGTSTQNTTFAASNTSANAFADFAPKFDDSAFKFEADFGNAKPAANTSFATNDPFKNEDPFAAFAQATPPPPIGSNQSLPPLYSEFEEAFGAMTMGTKSKAGSVKQLTFDDVFGKAAPQQPGPSTSSGSPGRSTNTDSKEVQALVNMGFTREKSFQALEKYVLFLHSTCLTLIRAGNDLQKATDILLGE